MGDLIGPLRAPSSFLSPAPGRVPPIPDVTLRRPSILGPAEGAATLDGFATGSAVLTASHQAQIVVLALTYQQLLADDPAGRISAVGHTDRIGTEADNDALGQARADAVQAALVAEGIDAGSIRTHSLGEEVPRVETDRAEPANRRVQLYFQQGPSLGLEGVFTEGMTSEPPLGSSPMPEIDLNPANIDRCVIMPELCRPGPRERDFSRRPGPLPERRLPSVSEAIWGPIDRSLERGLRDLGLSDTWNERLRDLARAGVGKAAQEVLDAAMDAADLRGETRDAVGTALRAAVQLRVPF